MRRLPAFRHDEETNQERRDEGHDDLRLLMPRKLHVPSPLLPGCSCRRGSCHVSSSRRGCFLRLFFGDWGSRRNMVPNSVSCGLKGGASFRLFYGSSTGEPDPGAVCCRAFLYNFPPVQRVPTHPANSAIWKGSELEKKRPEACMVVTLRAQARLHRDILYKTGTVDAGQGCTVF